MQSSRRGEKPMGTQKRRNGVQRRVGDVTSEEFCDAVREDQKADLIDGVIYMASPENTDANDLHGWLVAVLRPFVRRRKLGRVFSSRVAIRLDGQNAPEPDILVVRTEHLDRVQRGCITGPCDLAVAIVSPDSVERDYEKKRQLYERFKVPEYWIIDEHEQVVKFLRLGARGKYREVRPREGEYQSEALPGFWLRPEWLWQDPLPDELDILQQILSRKPPG